MPDRPPEFAIPAFKRRWDPRKYDKIVDAGLSGLNAARVLACQAAFTSHIDYMGIGLTQAPEGIMLNMRI